jgi:glyoxylase-like metal-dependent hydrolase (beta-lactamase superfamily II)
MTNTFPKVHIHTSSPDAFFVNSFIIEGVKSLVLVDTQFVLSEASVVAEKIAGLQKPLAAILITHPHPDHHRASPPSWRSTPEPESMQLPVP